MSSTLYLRESTLNGIGSFRDMLKDQPGSSATTGVVNTSASGTQIQWTKTAGGAVLEWISGRVPAGGFTLSGLMTFSLWAQESNMNANCGARARVFRRTPGGTETEVSGGPFDDGVEFSPTAATEMVWTGTPSSGLSFAEDDRIVVRFYITNIGTMGGGFTCTATYDAAAAATGDSFFQITETVTFKAESQTYNESISAAAAAGYSLLDNALAENSITAALTAGYDLAGSGLDVQEAISAAAAAAYGNEMSLDQFADISAAAAAGFATADEYIAEGTLALGLVVDCLLADQAVAENTLALAAGAGFALLDNVLAEDGFSLPATAALIAAGGLDVNEALSISALANFGLLDALTAEDSVTVSATTAFAVLDELTGGAIEEAITAAASAGFGVQEQLAAEAVLTLVAAAGFILSENATFENTLPLAVTAGMVPLDGLDLSESLTLAVVSAFALADQVTAYVPPPEAEYFEPAPPRRVTGVEPRESFHSRKPRGPKW